MIQSSEGILLEYEITEPVDPVGPFVFLCHPHPKMGGSMYNKIIDQLFKHCKRKKWGGIRFNFRGVGKSTGSYSNGIGEVEDLLSVVQWVRSTFPQGISSLYGVGYSFGAWVVAQASLLIGDCKGLFLLAPPISMYDFSGLEKVDCFKQIYFASKDALSPQKQIHSWFSLLKGPKEMEVIDGADHFFTGYTTRLIKSVIAKIETVG